MGDLNSTRALYDISVDKTSEKSTGKPYIWQMNYFLETWICESMGRCWNSVENSERLITRDNVIQLFGNLMEHSCSCIPLTIMVDHAPSRECIELIAYKVFDSWAAFPTGKRRQKGRGSGGEEAAKRQKTDGEKCDKRREVYEWFGRLR